MRRRLRAAKPQGGQVATCDRHLPDALRGITPERDGDTNDTHVIVRRLPPGGITPACSGHPPAHPAALVLIPQAVLR